MPEGFLLVKTVPSSAWSPLFFSQVCRRSMQNESAPTRIHKWDKALLCAADFIGHVAPVLVLVIRKRW